MTETETVVTEEVQNVTLQTVAGEDIRLDADELSAFREQPRGYTYKKESPRSNVDVEEVFVPAENVDRVVKNIEEVEQEVEVDRATSENDARAEDAGNGDETSNDTSNEETDTETEVAISAFRDQVESASVAINVSDLEDFVGDIEDEDLLHAAIEVDGRKTATQLYEDRLEELTE